MDVTPDISPQVETEDFGSALHGEACCWPYRSGSAPFPLLNRGSILDGSAPNVAPFTNTKFTFKANPIFTADDKHYSIILVKLNLSLQCMLSKRLYKIVLTAKDTSIINRVIQPQSLNGTAWILFNQDACKSHAN